jgi:nitric oxide reductase NorQ protein
MNAVTRISTTARTPTSVDIEPSSSFVSTPFVEGLTDRALAYLRAGYSVHLSGPPGTGKTTLAFHIAAKLCRPVTLMYGDHQLTSSDLIGSANGYQKSKLVDNFVHTVLRTEEQQTTLWADNRLTTACRHGHTLIYDEFNRTPPAANGPLLSVLAEGILNLPTTHSGQENYVAVHPKFRAILTSNPEDYVGVYKTMDSLLDRVVTIKLDHLDRQTEIDIVRSHSGSDEASAVAVVDLVRWLRPRHPTQRFTIRGAIAIARVLVAADGDAGDVELARWACRDILGVNELELALFPNPIWTRRVAPAARFGQTQPKEAAHDDPVGKNTSGPTAADPRNAASTTDASRHVHATKSAGDEPAKK